MKKTLYWCDECNVPLIGRTCACGNLGRALHLLEPYDIRPALAEDQNLIRALLEERFGSVPVPRILLLNKAGGLDRNDLVIANGTRFGWLSFDPAGRKFRFDISPEALSFMLPGVTKGVIELEQAAILEGTRDTRGRIGGKKFRVNTGEPDGTVIVQYRGRYGTAVLNEGWLRVKEVMPVTARPCKDPPWDEVIEKNRYHLKNLERNAVRSIKQHMRDRPCVNVSFSGGKDSTAVLLLARKAGVHDAFFIDTGIEFPETIAFVKSMGVEVVSKAGDFWGAVERAGPPAKDNRWCCKLLKQNPLRLHLAKTGPCVTIQGNRWYESWNRADLELAVQNPLNPLQLNISPIRNWRALEVFLYLWWQKAPINPLYDEGIERIGCYPCPSMLESEFAGLSRLHPDLASHWSGFLSRWAGKKGLPDEYVSFGLWRWKGLPNKMQELCRQYGIPLKETPDGFAVEPSQGHLKSPEKVPVPAMPPSAIPEIEPRCISDDNGRPVITMATQQIIPRAGDEAKPDNPDLEPDGLVNGDDDLSPALRNDFPILSDHIYLDNASISLMPGPVIMAVTGYERDYRGLASGGSHRLGGISAQRYWHAHEKVAGFIGGEGGLTIFINSHAEAIQLAIQGISWRPGDRVIITELEHQSDLRVWKTLAGRGIDIATVSLGTDYIPDLKKIGDLIGKGNVRMVIAPHVSDVFGSIAPLEDISRMCRARGALLFADGSQSVSRIPVNVGKTGTDLFYYSGHTSLAPTGTSVLWIRDTEVLSGHSSGPGNDSDNREEGGLRGAYEQYEPGIPNIAGGIGLGAAVDYLKKAGIERISRHDSELTSGLIRGLSGIEGVHVYAPANPEHRAGIVSFTVEGTRPREVAHYLDETADILVSAGHHDVKPLMESLGIEDGTVRAAVSLYNNKDDIDMLIATIEEIARGV